MRGAFGALCSQDGGEAGAEALALSPGSERLSPSETLRVAASSLESKDKSSGGRLAVATVGPMNEMAGLLGVLFWVAGRLGKLTNWPVAPALVVGCTQVRYSFSTLAHSGSETEGGWSDHAALTRKAVRRVAPGTGRTGHGRPR